MSLINNRSRRNAYTKKKRKPDEKEERRNNSGANRKKRAGEKTEGKKRFFPLPALRINAKSGFVFLRWMLSLSLVGLFFFCAGTGLIKAYNFCTTSSYFAISNIEVTGNLQVKTEDILKICGLEKGKNSLLINIHDAEQKLMNNPWIENVSIRRELPGNFTVTIKERIPLFCARKDNTLYYVNAVGKIIAPVGAKNFRSLPVLEVGPGGDDALPIVAEFVEAFRHAGFPFDISQISWLRLSAGGGFELYWEARRLRLNIGFEGWRDNLKSIASVVSDIEKRKETVMVTSIRAADGQVWMTKASQQ